MGDRVLYQVYSKPNQGEPEISPVVYAHWGAARARDVCARLQARMRGRESDLSYTAARLVQEVVNGDNGHLSFGLWNGDKLLAAEDSHGDGGVVLIECTAAGLRFQCVGGYLRATRDQQALAQEPTP